MRIPQLRGMIDRRILLNYRVDPDVLAGLLPEPFRARVVRGWGLAGVCLIRLSQLRPRGFPLMLGIGSENAAYRAAVEWETTAGLRQGVFIWRRVTSSRLNALAGGRVFPGVHQFARFDVRESPPEYRVRIVDADDSDRIEIDVDCREADSLPAESNFNTLDETRCFVCDGAIGYSPATTGNTFDGLHLDLESSVASPLAVTRLRANFFDDPGVFPAGSALFDHALLMRGVPHRWKSLPPIRAGKSISPVDNLCHTGVTPRQ